MVSPQHSSKATIQSPLSTTSGPAHVASLSPASQVEYVERGGDPRLLEGCLNIVLTGNPGAGKTTAARLLFRALRGYGLLRKEVCNSPLTLAPTLTLALALARTDRLLTRRSLWSATRLS